METADAVGSATRDELAGEPVRDRFTETPEFTDCVVRNRDLSRAAKTSSGARTRPTPCSPPAAGCASTSPIRPAPPAWTPTQWRRGRPAGASARTSPTSQTVTGESHAWIEAWTGGWWGYDPTSDIEIAHRHVWEAVGTAAALDVSVDMTRLA